MQLSHTIIPYTIISATGEVQHRVRKKENEIVPEWAGLMNAKLRDPIDMAELRALNLRKSKKQELASKRRGLYGNRNPIERSVSPMFGEVTQVDPAADNLYENDAAA